MAGEIRRTPNCLGSHYDNPRGTPTETAAVAAPDADAAGHSTPVRGAAEVSNPTAAHIAELTKIWRWTPRAGLDIGADIE